MEQEQKSFQRQIAYKIRISDILNGNFLKDVFSSGYIRLGNLNISRVNIIATIVFKSEQGQNHSNVVVDDGTARISLKSFENNNIFLKVDVGDIALVVGKIREFNGERYIVPETLKKIEDIGWVNVRKIELERHSAYDDTSLKTNGTKPAEAASNIDEEIYSLIRKLDDGSGVPVDEVIKNFSDSDAEIRIKKLLENGDIFEVKPARLKILE